MEIPVLSKQFPGLAESSESGTHTSAAPTHPSSHRLRSSRFHSRLRASTPLSLSAGGDEARALLWLRASSSVDGRAPQREREFCIHNLLVRIHLIFETVLVDRPCTMEPFSFFFCFMTRKPRVEWYKSPCALNTRPLRNRFTFLRSRCSNLRMPNVIRA